MSNVAIRLEDPADVPELRGMIARSFGRQNESTLVEQLRADGDAVVSAVAVIDESVVGYALLSRMSAPFRALGLGPVAIDPAWQRHGIGSLVIRWSLACAGQQGWQGVFVLGQPSFYSRFGFSVELAAGFTCRYGGPYLMALALDAPLPTLSGVVDYAPAFTAL